MREEPDATFSVLLILGFSLTGAALILSIPPLFGPHGTQQVWTTGVLGGLFVALAAVMVYVRATRPRSSGPNADE